MRGEDVGWGDSSSSGEDGVLEDYLVGNREEEELEVLEATQVDSEGEGVEVLEATQVDSEGDGLEVLEATQVDSPGDGLEVLEATQVDGEDGGVGVEFVSEGEDVEGETYFGGGVVEDYVVGDN